jgi:SAM-dependent methyltransferase
MPPGQYADDGNLRARQRLWQYQEPFFDIVAWVMDLAAIGPGMRVLDAGCGNGAYLRALRECRARAVGCDLSVGMLRAASHPTVFNADVTALPVRDGAFDAVLTAHMLYHVPDRVAAVGELRRILSAGGVCVTVTNGAQHMRSLRELVERAVGRETPGWQLRSPSRHAFAAENAAAQLAVAFRDVTCVRPPSRAPVVIRDAAVAADYVASVGDHYQHQVTRPWPSVVEEVRHQVQNSIDSTGAFVTFGDPAAFVCR